MPVVPDQHTQWDENFKGQNIVINGPKASPPGVYYGHGNVLGALEVSSSYKIKIVKIILYDPFGKGSPNSTLKVGLASREGFSLDSITPHSGWYLDVSSRNLYSQYGNLYSPADPYIENSLRNGAFVEVVYNKKVGIKFF